MNVLSKLFVDTRENILSVCLAVLHILRLDRLVRLGSSAAKRLLPTRLWPGGANARAIQAEMHYDDYDEGFDAQLPLSPVHIDHDGVETYEAVSALPPKSKTVDGEDRETLDDHVSTSSTRDELSESVLDDRDDVLESSSPRHVDLNEQLTGLLPLPPDEDRSESEETFSDETPTALPLETLEDTQASTQEPHTHLPVPLPTETERNGIVEPTAEATDGPLMAADQDEKPPPRHQQNGTAETVETSVGPVSAGLEDEPFPREPAQEQLKKTSALLPTISSVGGKAYAPIRREPASHEFKIPGIYIGDLVESKSPWATSSRNLLAKPSDRSVQDSEKMKKSTTGSADAEDAAVPALLTPVVKPMLESTETHPHSAVESKGKVKIPEDSRREDLHLSDGDGSREVSKAPLEEPSGLVVAMRTPLPDETLHTEDSVGDDIEKEGSVRGEEPHREMLEESSGLAVAMAEDDAANKQHKTPFLSRWEEGRNTEPAEMPRTLVKHALNEPQLQEETPQQKQDQLSRQEPTGESEEAETSSQRAVESSLKRKEATALLEESSGLAVAMESPLKKRKDEDEPEHEPPTKTAEDVPPLRRSHEMVDLLAEAHASEQLMKEDAGTSSAEQTSVSLSNSLSMSSPPEAYAMSLISPSSSTLRTTFVASTKRGDSSSPREELDSWKPEEAQREKRVSVQTNDTEDADNDRHWEESEANDAGEQRAAPHEVKQSTQTLTTGGRGSGAAPAARAESEISETDGQSVASTSEDEPWNSEDEEIFNAAPPFLGQWVSSAVYHTV